MKAALGLTLLVAAVYLLTASGHLDGQDQEYYYRMARSLARGHTFAIEPLVYQNVEVAGARGSDGRFYPQYAPCLPIALSPLVLLADSSGHAANFASNYQWLHQGSWDVTARVFVSYADVPVLAFSAGLLLLFVTRLGYSTGVGVFVSASFAVSTFAWAQSRSINAEPLQTLLLLGTALLTLHSSKTKLLVVAGSMLGLAILVKITSALALPALLLFPDEHDVSICRRPLHICAMVGPVIGALAAYACYNYERFDSIIATGYAASAAFAELPSVRVGNPITGLFGLLCSSGRGLVWYAPPVLGGVVGFGRMYRKKRSIARALAAFIGTWVVIHASYAGWDSGWGWGPRYLLPVLPFMHTPMAETLADARGRVVCIALSITGFVIQIPGALVDFMASGRAGMAVFAQTMREHSPQAFVAWRNFHVTGSEIVRHSALLWHGQIDVAWITFRNTGLPTMTFAVVTFLFTAGIAILALFRSGDRRKNQNLVGAAP